MDARTWLRNGADAMKSPWTSRGALRPDVEYLVLATHLPARRRRSTWALLRGAHAVRRQLDSSDGVLGYSLLAEPMRRNYATLSVWRDEQALQSFVQAPPHGRLMRDLASHMDETTFVQWTISGAQGPPSWREALDRLA